MIHADSIFVEFNGLRSNKSLERTVKQNGHTVRAFAIGARAGVEMQSWPAVHRNR